MGGDYRQFELLRKKAFSVCEKTSSASRKRFLSLMPQTFKGSDL